jgi:primosomal protein N' (replication factor Y) (superfamily II helicase)
LKIICFTFDTMSTRITLFVDVVLPLAVDRLFTYRVPHEFNEQVQQGVRVVVPFGKTKFQTGIILSIHENPPKAYQVKYIESVLDEQPIVVGKQVQFWNWIAEYYMSTMGEVMNAALPANFKLGSETKIALHPDFDSDTIVLNDEEFLLVEALTVQDTLDLLEVSTILDKKNVHPFIKKLIDKRIVVSVEELKWKYAPKHATYLRLSDDFQKEEALRLLMDELQSKERSAKQMDALLLFLQRQNSDQPHVAKVALLEAGATESSLKSLEKKSVLVFESLEISRLKLAQKEEMAKKTLSEDQNRALQEIQTAFESKDVCLLHGVTGSGKTEIYVELIDEQLKNGKQVLFLLPEIALTTQLINRLAAYFGDLVGVYHSKFNQNERVEIWNAVLHNAPDKFRIIVGARSAVFLPYTNLGLIIVDEEHESSFKQHDPAPRYHGRDAAIVLGMIHKAPILLGSATPALETYYNTEQGKYALVALNSRFGGVQMPEILIADLAQERKQTKNLGVFSNFLLDEIRKTLDNEEQVILFQNRRGYTPYWMCEVCNWTPSCKSCDVTLTYHKTTNTLKCHYCGYATPPMGSCANCGSNKIKMVGYGTERIEDELALLFPKIKIGRLDLDSTRSKDAYSRVLESFAEKKIDILVGTQMITKGLDFDHVSLVGILDADHILRYPDFRSFERGFQLMTQVSGRAGRKSKRGKVIIQTGQPDQWIIQKVIENDYLNMYKQELIERRNFSYPPFTKLIQITLKHKDAIHIDGSAAELAQALKDVFGSRVVGPEFPLVRRVQNLYIKIIRLKIERSYSQKQIKEKVKEIIDAFYAAPHNKSVRLTIDVDVM